METHSRVIAGRWEGQAIFKYICSAEMKRYVVCSWATCFRKFNISTKDTNSVKTE